MWLALGSNINDAKIALAAQLTARRSAEVSPELIAELKNAFKACDVNSDSLLNLAELKDALQGADIVMEDDEVEAALKAKSPETLVLDANQYVSRHAPHSHALLRFCRN